MKILTALVLILSSLCLGSAAAGSTATPTSWIDVVATYGADNTCLVDSTTAINNAIAAVPATGGVLFFQSGCYLVKSQIVDNNSTAIGVTYLGFGRVQIKSFSTTTPPQSIIKLGDDTHTIQRRKIVNLAFNCNDNTMDGIDVDGLANSEFDDVDITYCHGSSNWHMRTYGNNGNNYANNYIGGLILGDATGSNGINIGGNSVSAGANLWTFVGVKLEGQGSHGANYGGVGLDLEGVTGSFYGGNVSEWNIGICLGCNSPGSSGQVGGFVVSGSYLENNPHYGIRVGNAGYGGSKAAGFTIEGNYINCNGVGTTSVGVELEEAAGYSVTGNLINGCNLAAIRGLTDGTNQGADNGFVGANFVESGQPISLAGSNNMTSTQFSTKSSAYTLVATDTWVNVTGTTTITVPHGLTGQKWDVFNSGTGTVSLVCDSGTINGGTSVSLSTQTGKAITVDGTNCFAH